MAHVTRVALMMSAALILFFVLGQHVYRRLDGAFALPRWIKPVWAAALVTAPLCSVLPRFFSAYLGNLASALGVYAGVIVMGILLSSVLLSPYELARGLNWVWRKYPSRLRLTPRNADEARDTVREAHADGLAIATSLAHQTEPFNDPSLSRLRARAEPRTSTEPSRRTFLQQAAVGGAVSLGMGSVAYGTSVGRHDYQLETVPVRLAKLPSALDGITIVQLSDLHVGTFVGDYELSRAIELVKRAKPDLVVLTGDLMDHDLAHAHRLFRFARTLQSSARYGVFAIPGNHDHYTGVLAIERGLREAGADVLVNRHVRIGDGKTSFVLAGLDDVAGQALSQRGPDITAAFRGAPPELARVLLSHNPSYFPTSHSSADLTLSGHTHGGQISLFINPAEFLLQHGYVRGHYTREQSQLYVNRGFGTAGPPTRIGSPPEVTRLVLTT